MAGLLSKTIIALLAIILLKFGQGTIEFDGDFRGSLEFVTSADDSFYYANHQLLVDFQDALKYCKSFGMQLGSVRTRGQYYALMGELKPLNNYGYWTSASLSGLPSMFRWGDTGSILDGSQIPSWENRWFSPRFCVIIYNSHTETHPAGLYPVGCSNEQPVLCETTLKV